MWRHLVAKKLLIIFPTVNTACSNLFLCMSHTFPRWNVIFRLGYSIYHAIEWRWTGFGLVIGFIGLLNTTSDCTSQITILYWLVFSATVFTALLGSGFQRWTFPFFWIPKLPSASVVSFSLLSQLQLSTECLPETLSRLLVKSKSKLLYDLPPVHRGVKSLVTHDQRSFFFQLSPCGNSPYVTSSLTRRWVCLL
jgi:hypothetical protein